VSLDDGVKQSAILSTNTSLVYGAADLACGYIDLIAGSARVLQIESSWYDEAQYIGSTVPYDAVLLYFLRQLADPTDAPKTSITKFLGRMRSP